jgi:hypothetical protein
MTDYRFARRSASRPGSGHVDRAGLIGAVLILGWLVALVTGNLERGIVPLLVGTVVGLGLIAHAVIRAERSAAGARDVSPLWRDLIAAWPGTGYFPAVVHCADTVRLIAPGGAAADVSLRMEVGVWGIGAAPLSTPDRYVFLPFNRMRFGREASAGGTQMRMGDGWRIEPSDVAMPNITRALRDVGVQPPWATEPARKDRVRAAMNVETPAAGDEPPVAPPLPPAHRSLPEPDPGPLPPTPGLHAAQRDGYRLIAPVSPETRERLWVATAPGAPDEPVIVKALTADGPERDMLDALRATGVRDDFLILPDRVGAEYVAMPHGGRPLSALLDAAPYDPDALTSPAARRSVVTGIFAGLRDLHAAGIAHGDLSPANVLVDRSADGTPVARLIDFGLALRVTPDPTQHSLVTQSLAGTPYFADPAVIEGQPRGPRSDLYAAGLIASRVLTGRFPSHGEPLPDWMIRCIGRWDARFDDATEAWPIVRAALDPARPAAKPPAPAHRSSYGQTLPT